LPAAERVPALIRAVRSEGNFDVDEPTALGWLSATHRTMVRRARCLRKRVSLGSTIEGQGAYPLPDEVLEVLETLVNGVPLGSGQHSDIAASAQSWLLISGTGQLAAPDNSATGQPQVTLVPPPSTSGEPIEVYAVCRGGALEAEDDTTLNVPAGYDVDLIAGAIAIGLERDAMSPGLARPYREQFDAACTELRREVAKRYRPREARVSGYNA
jgi:hypothetical protein